MSLAVVLLFLFTIACRGDTSSAITSTSSAGTDSATGIPGRSATATPVPPTATVRPAATPLPRPTIEIASDVSTTYYSVYGTETTAIFDSVDLNAPRLDSGEIGLGLTSWSFPEFDWERGPVAGNCRIISLTMTVAIVVTLPELVEFSIATPEVQQRWLVLAEEIAVHEQTHVDIVLAGVDELRKRMEVLEPAASCSDIDASVAQLLDEAYDSIDVANDTFHAADDAMLEARRMPLQQQVEANQAELVRLEGELNSLEASLATTEATLDSIEAHMAGLEIEIQQIESSYPGNVLPPDVYDRYSVLIDEYNGSLSEYNGLVAQYNQTVSSADGLTGQYNALVDATNALIEQINWFQ